MLLGAMGGALAFVAYVFTDNLEYGDHHFLYHRRTDLRGPSQC